MFKDFGFGKIARVEIARRRNYDKILIIQPAQNVNRRRTVAAPTAPISMFQPKSILKKRSLGNNVRFASPLKPQSPAQSLVQTSSTQITVTQATVHSPSMPAAPIQSTLAQSLVQSSSVQTPLTQTTSAQATQVSSILMRRAYSPTPVASTSNQSGTQVPHQTKLMVQSKQN